MFGFLKKKKEESKPNVMRFSGSAEGYNNFQDESDDDFTQDNYQPPDPNYYSDNGFSDEEESESEDEIDRGELYRVVTKFYEKHDQTKIQNGLESIVDIGMRYGVPALNESLVKKYGEGLSFTDDAGQEVPVSIRMPTEDETEENRKFLLTKLEAFYTVHDPSKFDNTDAFYALVEWGLRYGVKLLNEKLIKKYGEGMEGVDSDDRKSIIKSTRDWRKSGLPTPVLPTYGNDSDSYESDGISDEDDYSYADGESYDDFSEEEPELNDQRATNKLKFAQKLFPSGLMNEYEEKKETPVAEPSEAPVARQPKSPQPCSTFTLDVEANDFAMCMCGHSKAAHGLEIGVPDEANASLKREWKKQKEGHKDFRDPLESRTFKPEKTKAEWLRNSVKSLTRKKSNDKKAEKKVEQPKKRPEVKKEKSSKSHYDKMPKKKSGSRVEKKSNNKPRVINSLAPNPKAIPHIPKPTSSVIAVDSTEEPAKRGNGPCSTYKLDLTGNAYGNCTCGYSRAEHSKAKYKPRVAMSLQLKWNQSPYRNNTPENAEQVLAKFDAVPEGGVIKDSKSPIPNGDNGKAKVPEVSNPKYHKESSSKSKRKPSNAGRRPSNAPSRKPSHAPSRKPSHAPSRRPSNVPSRRPSNAPSRRPSNAPSRRPSNASKKGSAVHQKEKQKKQNKHTSAISEKSNEERQSWDGNTAKAPTKGQNRKFKEVRNFLANLHLEFLYKPLINLGVEVVSDLKYLEEQDMDTLKIKPIQRRKLMKAIKNM